jgi:hypothetical protein
VNHPVYMSKNRIHLNDTTIDVHNPIFEGLKELSTKQQHTHYIRQNEASLASLHNKDTQNNKKKGPLLQIHKYIDRTTCYMLKL